jgi:threonine dehydrogenase-like Zn-dependent dehydrogenase
MLADGRVNGKALHTHSFSLNQFGEALATFVEKREGAMKVVLKP